MAIYKITRFAVRADALVDVERVLHEYATYVRASLPLTMFTAYRDPHVPTQLTGFYRFAHEQAEAEHDRADGTRAFRDALAPMLVGDIAASECELVTSSDLAPRPRPTMGGARRRGRSS